MAEKKFFCDSCGVKVEAMTVLMDGDERDLCAACGSPVHPIKDAPPPPPPPSKMLNTVIAAEDSNMLLEMMGDILRERKLVKNFIGCGDGEQFIELFTKALISRKNVDLVIMDISMPRINGMNAAMALRAIERATGQKRHTPILFFSAKQADDKLRKAFEYLRPSSYVNKGEIGDPVQLSERIYRVLIKLLDM